MSNNILETIIDLDIVNYEILNIDDLPKISEIDYKKLIVMLAISVKTLNKKISELEEKIKT